MKQLRALRPPYRIALAYLMAFPLRQAPEPALLEFMTRLMKNTGVEIQFVMSERLVGNNQTFEATIRTAQDIALLRDVLTTYGWHPMESPRDPMMLRCRKGDHQFVFMLIHKQ